ncbi:uncharacterized protein PRCAT00004588001 [Priceomyces carsonii]|uniref:uncharacterized protein n=1 Tax=Priceomyces carsonii TaxID=28549 RepID=UPI002ED8F80F|nr:unnamed protein product [Priceomyces carsonii]
MADIKQLLKPLVEAIQKGDKKVTFFQGAGVSTSAGIPDFRSPKTGLYSNLAKLNLPYPEAVFDIDFFRDDPKAFYTLAEELYPGKFVPTEFHYLTRLLQDKNLLNRIYTQNIDTLERVAGIDGEYIVEAHGSFANNHCIDCSAEMSTEELKKHMDNKEHNEGIPLCPKCKGYVKPDIVFFGEGLPSRFFEQWEEDSDKVEIAVIVGTSLTVYPFASLPSEIGSNLLRVLVNNEMVGDFKRGKRKKDIVILEDCDKVARELAKQLEWEEELDKLIEEGRQIVIDKENKIASDVAAELAEEIKEVEINHEKPGQNSEGHFNDASKSNEINEEKKLEDEISKLKI